MLGIIICEDNEHQKKQIESIIKNELINLKIEVSTTKYEEVIAYVKSNKKRSFIYFLDVDLKDQISGIELAKIIRRYDSNGYIVFITSHSEFSILTYKYKVQALDYILKSDSKNIKKRISECILESCKDYNKNNIEKENTTITINLGNRINKFSLHDILFFETTIITHKLRLHTLNGEFEFYGKLKDLHDLNSYFYKAHKSYLVNIDNISSIDKRNHIIYFVNDETCFVSTMYMNGLIKKCLD